MQSTPPSTLSNIRQAYSFLGRNSLSSAENKQCKIEHSFSGRYVICHYVVQKIYFYMNRTRPDTLFNYIKWSTYSQYLLQLLLKLIPFLDININENGIVTISQTTTCIWIKYFLRRTVEGETFIRIKILLYNFGWTLAKLVKKRKSELKLNREL